MLDLLIPSGFIAKGAILFPIALYITYKLLDNTGNYTGE